MTRILRGTGVSPGIAVGRVLVLHPDARPVVAAPIEPERVEGELVRLRHARDAARGELQELRDRIRGALGEHFAAVFEVQLLILDDPALVGETERRIREQLVEAPWALQEATTVFLRRFDAVIERTFRERGGDLADVHRRLQRHLRGGVADVSALPHGPLVLVARALGPSEAVALVREGVVGLAIDGGGPTSHTAILAQALSIPAVVGLHDASRHVRSGEEVVLDGELGELHLSPDRAKLAQAQSARERWLAAESSMASTEALPVVTSDGVEIVLRANIELPEQVSLARRNGASGVGLYRSEFLFLAHGPRLPSEEEHYQAYRAMAEAFAPHPVVIRTLDLDGERYFRDVGAASEANPVLGLRAVRFCLQRPDIFLPQLRALLRAAAHGDVRILIPLVTTCDEIHAVRRLLRSEAESLRAAGVACRADPPVGAMVEVPAAAMIADQLASEADFLSIGTNDLIQYSLAVDRGNESVTHLYRPLHPGVLRMIDFTVRSAVASGKPISLCGEMAADPSLAPLLVGFGLRELSVEPRALPTVMESLRRLSAARSRELATHALTLPSAQDVARYISAAGDGGVPQGAAERESR